MAIVQVSVLPIGTGTTSVSKWVKETYKVLESHKELQYELTPMSTVIEGNLDEVLKAVRDMHEAPFRTGVDRVITNISIDDRRDKPLTLRGKVDSVMRKL